MEIPPASWCKATEIMGATHRSPPILAFSLGAPCRSVKIASIRLWKALFITIEVAIQRLLPEQRGEFELFLEQVAIQLRVRLSHLPVCSVVPNYFADAGFEGGRRYISRANRPLLSRSQCELALKALIEITRDFATIVSAPHRDMARGQAPGLARVYDGADHGELPAYHPELQKTINGIRMEAWTLAGAFNALPGDSAAEWDVLSPTTPWLDHENQETHNWSFTNFMLSIGNLEDPDTLRYVLKPEEDRTLR